MKLSINRLMKLIPEWNGKLIRINKINSGITNINFKVIVGKKSFFLSMPSSNSELLNIDYRNKYYNNKICGEINISPKVTHFIESENLLVTEFIKSKHSSLAIFQSSKGIEQLVKNIKLLHNANPFLRNFNMLTQITYYQNILKKDFLPKELNRYINNIKSLNNKLYLPNHKLVSCHNDLLAENIINKNNQIFIVDFDYSGNNDPCFELGNLSVEMEYDDEQINKLVRSYYGEINENIISRVNLQGVVSDIGWSLWSYVQVKNSTNLNFDYSTHAIYRLERAINKMESKEYELWINNI
jgi:thiamine kinase-like enzyme